MWYPNNVYIKTYGYDNVYFLTRTFSVIRPHIFILNTSFQMPPFHRIKQYNHNMNLKYVFGPAGLLDTITSTADSKDCPGVCVHTLATLICYEVLENVKCPSPTMRCCVEPPPLSANGTAAAAAVNKVDQTTPSIASSVKPQVSRMKSDNKTLST